MNTGEQLASWSIGRFDEIQEAIAQARPIVLAPNGEDCTTLTNLGLPATFITAHVNGTLPEACRRALKGADIVLIKTADEAWRAKANVIVDGLYEVTAKIRIFDLISQWPLSPEAYTLAEWVSAESISADLFFERAADLPPYKTCVVEIDPENTYRSKFGAIQWCDLKTHADFRYEYIIENLIPFRESVLIAGESQSGKSFFTFDMAIHVAAGFSYEGLETTKVGVIYIAAEKGKGFKKRMKAFQKFHGLTNDDFPFAVLTRSVDIFSSEEIIDQLAEECRELSKRWKVPLGVIVIDTHDAATPGASEIDKKDVTLILRRYKKLQEMTGAGAWIIHHMSAAGNIRGSLVLYNAIETVILISIPLDRNKEPTRDLDKRIIRVATVRKQSEGEAGKRWEFVLQQVDTGEVDRYKNPETSCVVREANKFAGDKEGIELSGNAFEAFKALLEALGEHGEVAQSNVRAPRGARIVARTNWAAIYDRQNSETEPDADRRAERVKKALTRAVAVFKRKKLIGVDNIGPKQWVWVTGTPVQGLAVAQHMSGEAPKVEPEQPAKPFDSEFVP